MNLLCRNCGKTVDDVVYYADPQFWNVPMKQIFCGAQCSTQWVEKNKHWLKRNKHSEKTR